MTETTEVHFSLEDPAKGFDKSNIHWHKQCEPCNDSCPVMHSKGCVFYRGDNGTLREFDTGATRDTAEGKLEPWGFTSALVEKRYSEYMHRQRIQSDGNLRDSDNWKKGIPIEVYKHSLSRHIEDLRLILEGFPEQAREQDLETVLCAVKFNIDGMLHEVIKNRLYQKWAE